MIQPIYAKYLEFDNVILDLTNVVIEDCDDDTNNEEYIIFMNVKGAFYKNFHFICDLSLESLTLFIYNKLRLTIQEVEYEKSAQFVDFIFFNDADNGNSMIIELCSQARVIVAKKLYPGEKYHQRVSGFIEFQQRHYTPRPEPIVNLQMRNEIDRELEIKLYKS
ncbi:hypothetical protein [Lonomia obliqua multiple nucleopolyhedrovirus]|uniref:Ac57 n=1 Tax=Lonomia obliqua multiple nucleopolyhedrovirus TaxID=134394 RepID=A0A126FCC9_9ABAC|nr:hypothetical protein [Lonomia obliqua multiple nucleopolyhedrovirus]AKN81054.1 hypothetical protein [Lonomia obliqua multiple nucleopolyhedrovirus]